MAALATVLFDAAKHPANEKVFTAESLSDAVDKLLRSWGRASKNGYGVRELYRDLTRFTQRLERSTRRFERLGIVRVGGPRASSRGDSHEGYYFLEIETDPLLNPAVAAAVIRSSNEQLPASVTGWLKWITTRFQRMSEARRAELDRLSAQGKHGIIAALVAILVGCATALYYVRTSHVSLAAATIRTAPDATATIVRWKTTKRVGPRFEVLRDGRVIASTSENFYIDRERHGPFSVYRVAGRWQHLARATSRATLGDYYVEQMQPCNVVIDADGDTIEALCVPTFREGAFLQESFNEFDTPLDAAAFAGWRVEHSTVIEPQEPVGATLDLSRDVLRITRGDGRALAPGTQIARTIDYRERGRFPLAITTPDGKSLKTDRYVRVYDGSEFSRLAVTRNPMPPARLLADGKLLAAPPIINRSTLVLSAVDRPEQRTVDVLVRLPADSPFIPIVWETGRPTSLQREMVAVPGTPPARYVARLEIDGHGMTQFQILGRRFLFDRTHLADFSLILGTRPPRPYLNIPDDRPLDLSRVTRSTRKPH